MGNLVKSMDKGTFCLRLGMTSAIFKKIKQTRGQKVEGRTCFITTVLHVGYCHWLECWRNIWPSGKIN